MVKRFLPGLVIAGIIIPILVIAQGVKLNLNYPDFGPFNPSTNQSLAAVIGYVYYFIVGIAGLAAFVMLVWGGVQWLTSGAAPSMASEARDKVRNAIVGLLLVLASFLVIQVINPELTAINPDLLVNLDFSALNKWLFSGEGTGRAAYQCSDWKDISGGKALQCEGNIPLSPAAPEACTNAAPAPNLNVADSCFRRCVNNGGEWAEFSGKSYCCNLPAVAVTCEFPAGNTLTLEQSTQRVPRLNIPYHLTQSVMRTEFGVYGCDGDNCRGGPDWAWRKFLTDTPIICGSTVLDSFPKNEDLCSGGVGGGSEIGSLWIHGPLVAVLYENENYGGKKICFDGRDQTIYPSPPGRLINRLEDCDIGALGIHCTSGANHGNGWDEDTSSIRILDGSEESPNDIVTLCPRFEETLAP